VPGRVEAHQLIADGYLMKCRSLFVTEERVRNPDFLQIFLAKAHLHVSKQVPLAGAEIKTDRRNGIAHAGTIVSSLRALQRMGAKTWSGRCLDSDSTDFIYTLAAR